MGDHQTAACVVRVLRHAGDHFRQGLPDGQALAKLLNLALAGSAAQELYPQGAGDQGLHLGQAAVLAEIIQIFQDEQGLHPGNIGLHLFHHPGEGQAPARQFPD